MPHMKNSLYSSLVFNQEHVFLQTQYAKCWMGPLDNSTGVKIPKMSVQSHDIAHFSTNADMAVPLLHLFLFMEFTFEITDYG